MVRTLQSTFLASAMASGTLGKSDQVSLEATQAVAENERSTLIFEAWLIAGSPWVTKKSGALVILLMAVSLCPLN